MNKRLESATLANGCFWCTEAIFKRLNGIISVIPGYAGGTKENPTYEEVSKGATGHAESTQIEFDPNIIPYEKILQVFWHTHNPTTLNKQGNDIGTQYRSVIFYHSKKQKKEALRSKEEIEKTGLYKNKIVTEIVPFTNFYEAESYHKDYFDKNRDYPYCTYIIDPKIQKLREIYGKDIKKEYQQ